MGNAVARQRQGFFWETPLLGSLQCSPPPPHCLLPRSLQALNSWYATATMLFLTSVPFSRCSLAWNIFLPTTAD